MKFKALADNKSDNAKMMISIFDGLENNVGKGEYAGYQHFPLSPSFLNRFSFSHNVFYSYIS